MKNGFEIYTDNGGGITLFIIRDEKAVAAFTDLQMLLNNWDGGETFRSMIGELCADPSAYEDWESAWDGEDCTVDDLYAETASPDRNHDIPTLDMEGAYDERWRCTVTVYASPKSGVAELLGWSADA